MKSLLWKVVWSISPIRRDNNVGIEVYDLSLYEESSEEYYAALGQMEEDWFPRPAVVIPKGPEGETFPMQRLRSMMRFLSNRGQQEKVKHMRLPGPGSGILL